MPTFPEDDLNGQAGMNDPPEPPDAGVDELERMLALPAQCEQCTQYAEMLRILLEENTELNAKVMEADAARKVAEEMLPPEIRKFLINQAEAAARLTKAKELAEQQAALAAMPPVQGLVPPQSQRRPAVVPIPPKAAPVGKVVDWRGVIVPAPNTITDPDNSYIIPFGKYRGRMLIEIESDYLMWCLNATDQGGRKWLRPEPRDHMVNVLKLRGVLP